MITDDDMEAPAALHSYLSGPMGIMHPDPPRGTLREMIGAAMALPVGDRLSSRILLDEGASLGWTQITTIAARNDML